ncbi:MAG: hypothetical protein ABSB54_09605 [Acidimicrobiales bacterium]|jgi:hypothetical protein
MTALTTLIVPARQEEGASLRPVPWRRMAWVIWRQHRIALGGVAAFLGALAAYVWILGLQLHHAYAAATACNPASSACSDLITNFNFMNHVLQGGYVLQLVPPLIGAFIGAPVLARELETGTFRYAWTQGFGRSRWALAKLVALGVVVASAGGAFSVLVSWYYQPYFAATGHPALNLSEASPFSLALFDLRGVSFAAWTLAAFAIGGLAGMVIRRVVPAIVATLAAYTGLALVAANLLRQHYLSPLLTRAVNVPGSAWVMSQWWTKGGKFAFYGWRDAPHDLLQACASPPGPLGKPSQETLAQCFAQHGYTQLTSYQPASRFWPFQWIEGGWLLALSVLLIAVTLWLVRRRAS